MWMSRKDAQDPPKQPRNTVNTAQQSVGAVSQPSLRHPPSNGCEIPRESALGWGSRWQLPLPLAVEKDW